MAPRRLSSDSVRRVEVQSASEVLAATLRAQILAGDLPAGTQLPVERDLSEQTGLSRTVVREALQTLGREGLVRTRAGRNGGTTVTRPTTSSIIRSLDQFAQAGEVEIDTLLEARELIEPICAGLAAERRSAEQLAELDDIQARFAACVRNAATFRAENVRWHVAVARASGNVLLASVVEGLSHVLQAGTENRRLSVRDRPEVIRAHASIMTAIRDQDREAAVRRMRRHIVAYRARAGSPSR